MVPFRLLGGSSLLRQAGYQKPKSGALLDGLISVIRPLFMRRMWWQVTSVHLELYPACQVRSRSLP